MTIEELRERKRELLARKKFELELQEKGEGDPMALFMVNEELGDVNAKLRAMSPKKHGAAPKKVHDAYAGTSGRIPSDWQQYHDWLRREGEDGNSDERSEMFRQMQVGIESLSQKQRTALLLWSDGWSVNEIAERFGVHPSVASRALSRAKKNLSRLAKDRMTVERLREGARLDLSKPEAAKTVLSNLTLHQAICFYLYYSEQLRIREIGDLLGVDHATICRTTKRALRRIGDVLGEDVEELENADALDDLLFATYRELCDQVEELPPPVRTRVKVNPSQAYQSRAGSPRKWKTKWAITLPGVIEQRAYKAKRKEIRPREHGRLLQALLARYEASRGAQAPAWSTPIARWLEKVFGRFVRKTTEKKTGGCKK